MAADTTLVPDDPMFRSAVMAAIDGAVFTPAELDGDPMPYWLILEFVFRIDAGRPPRRRPALRPAYRAAH